MNKNSCDQMRAQPYSTRSSGAEPTESSHSCVGKLLPFAFLGGIRGISTTVNAEEFGKMREG